MKIEHAFMIAFGLFTLAGIYIAIGSPFHEATKEVYIKTEVLQWIMGPCSFFAGALL